MLIAILMSHKERFLIYTVFSFFLITFIDSTLGAEITLSKDSWGDPFVDISGKIEKGDLTKIQKASAMLIKSLDQYSTKSLKFHLNTPGGDIEEAMKIGRFARQVLASIDSYGKIIIAPGSDEEKSLIKSEELLGHKDNDYVILQPSIALTEEHIVRNYSAGIFIFYGAAKRSIRDNSDQRLGFYKKIDIPVMGIHRPYYEREFYSKLSPAQAAEAYKYLEKSVRSYLAEMGAPQEIIDRMFNRSSNQIDLLSDSEFRKYYKPEESFLEEWLIAKCGAYGEQNILKGSELEDFYQIVKWQVASKMADRNSSDKSAFYIYPSERFAQSYMESLYGKVRAYNGSVNSCHEKAVTLHQHEWAKNYK